MTSITGVELRISLAERILSRRLLSSAVQPSTALAVMIITSAPSATASDLSTPILSTTSSVSRIPAVSSRVTGIPLTVILASTTSRVVPAMSVTIALSLLLQAFRRLDLPTLGRPTIATCKPDCRSLS
uniref:Uncharacterized protein n=1 Tax=Opuntia streptacantha TaxID=393608 RepID=A0A7C9F693_OPUST